MRDGTPYNGYRIGAEARKIGDPRLLQNRRRKAQPIILTENICDREEARLDGKE